MLGTKMINHVQKFHIAVTVFSAVQQIQIQDDSKDSWHYIWGNSTYTATRFYHLPYKNVQPPRSFIWLWDSSCANKIKVFAWML
jgi:hypothetical protein